MRIDATEVTSPLSRWSSRLALFAVVVVAVAILLHRVFSFPTPAAFTLIGLAYAMALCAVLSGVLASIGIWRHGRPGTARVVVGISLGLALLVSPLAILTIARDYPMINDITTDPSRPPAFNALASVRGGVANPAAYPGDRAAGLQRAAYPDLKPLDVNRSVTETYDMVLEVLRGLHYEIVAEMPPGDETPEGAAEAVDRTLVLGFRDDIAVRISPLETGSRIDLRSASRFGRSDFGRNAERLREIFREIVARLESTVPAEDIEVIDTPNKKNVKRPKNEGPASARKQRDGAPSNTRRAP